MKKIWNYLPILSTLIVIFISHVALTSLNEIVYFAIIFSLPLISNTLMVYFNFNEQDKKKRNSFCFFSTVLQLLPLLVLLLFSDSEGILIVFSYTSYIVIISVLLFLLLLALTHTIKQSAKIIKGIYVLSVVILFAVFFSWFYLVCYLF